MRPIETLSDRELDALVAEKVMGWTDIWTDGDYFMAYPPHEQRIMQKMGVGYAERYPIPNYSSEISAAWEVVEKMRQEGLTVTITTPPTGWKNWDVRGWDDNNNDNRFIARADTAPRAICIAALHAKGVREVE